eukprot:TRINITY_DN122_c0_g1_i1.p1 TRINITY_DN122_c0_g1~~TRINITY_DN122_c0_g1_i1.p1  ORF type:complete len:186 (-),score=45.96 TRINITY_DN122_c0_g1_i1:211-768(-)
MHLHKNADAHAHTHTNAAVVAPVAVTTDATTKVNAPIVEETVRTDKVVEVQPVIHREVERPVINHIEKHINEGAAPSMSGTVQMAPVVETHTHTHVINEVQPIIHREVAAVQVDRVEEHQTQRVVEAPIHTHEVVYENAAAPGVYSQTQTTVAPGVYSQTTTTTTVDGHAHTSIGDKIRSHLHRH